MMVEPEKGMDSEELAKMDKVDTFLMFLATKMEGEHLQNSNGHVEPFQNLLFCCGSSMTKMA